MFVAVLALLVALPLAAVADSPIIIEFQIHPKLNRETCGALPDASAVAEEVDFSQLASRGWVSLKSHMFQADRKLWPCIQDVRVDFPSAKLYREFAGAMSACPQYPFYSGADYSLQTRIFERTADLGDTDMAEILLAKDGRCASEMNPPLYSILRRNPAAFVGAFARLQSAEQRVAAASQFDFNLPLVQQQFSAETIAALPESLRPVAAKFNTLIAASAK